MTREGGSEMNKTLQCVAVSTRGRCRGCGLEDGFQNVLRSVRRTKVSAILGDGYGELRQRSRKPMRCDGVRDDSDMAGRMGRRRFDEEKVKSRTLSPRSHNRKRKSPVARLNN